MARRQLVLLLGMILLVGIGLISLVRVLVRKPAEHPATTSAPAESTEPQAPADEPLQTPATAEAPATADAIEATDSNPAREHVDEANAIPPDAIWIEGRVVFPTGTPDDERVEVLAASLPKTAKSRHVSVAADGAFRAPFAKGTEKASLDLESRFVYLSAPLELAPASRTADSPQIVLEPKLGGCVHGRVVLPPNALDRAAVVAGARATLSAIRDVQTFDFRDAIHRGTTIGDDLAFELGGIPEGGQVWLNVQAKGFAGASLRDLKVNPGRVTDVEVRLVLGARIAGRVVDEHGVPVAGVRLGVHIERGRTGSSFGHQEKTGEDGTFQVEGVHPGRLTLEAHGSGLARAKLVVGDVVDGGVHDGLEIVLGVGEPIHGRVQWPDGRPAEGCRIEFEATEASEEFWVPSEEAPACTSVADGTFEIGSPGKDALDLTAKLRAPAGAEGVGVARIQGVRPGTNGIVLVLELGRSVRGRAIDDLGAPLAAFEAAARPVDDRQPWRHEDAGVHVPGKDGAFAIDGLADGTYDVVATAKGHAPSAPHRVAVPQDTEPFDLVLPRSASATGIVVDPSGKPVQGARIQVSEAEDRFGVSDLSFSNLENRDGTGKTDAEGRFTIEDLAPGARELVASAPDLAESEPVVLEVAPAQSVTGLVLALRRGGRIAGEVLDDAGRPDGGRMVNVHASRTRDSRMRVHRRASADDAGRFDVAALPPGKYRLFAEPSEREIEADVEEETVFGRMPKMAVADVVDGETTHVVLGGAPKSGIRVHGTITAGGHPVSRCSVLAAREALEEGTPRTSTTDDAGRYEIVVDGAGLYMFAIQDQKTGVSNMDRVDVPAGEEVAHDIALPGGRIAGRVIGADGSPAAKLSVILQPEMREAELSSSASFGMKETDEKGAFVFEGLKAGTYTFRTGPGSESPKTGMAVRTGLVLEADGHIDDLEVRLEAPARIEGTVTGLDGQPVRGARIVVQDESGSPIEDWSAPTSDGSGRFAVEGLPASKVFVVARTKKLVSPASSLLTLRSGETSRVALTLRAGTVLRVFVEEKDGKPVLASLTVTDDQGRDAGVGSWLGGDPDEERPTPAAGLRIGPVLPGHYKVTATNHDRASVSREVDVSGDEIEVRLKF